MRVVMYTKKPCVQCDATRRKLDSYGVTPIEIRVDDEAGALILEELKAEGFGSAPVLKVYDVVDPLEVNARPEVIDSWAGYIPDKIDEHFKPKLGAEDERAA